MWDLIIFVPDHCLSRFIVPGSKTGLHNICAPF